MQATPIETTVTEVKVARAQLKIPRSIWDRIKIQSIHEGIPAEQLASRIFDEYLESPAAIAARK